MSSNYGATVVQINTLREHDNADRLQCTNIFGFNVIVGLDTKVGDVGLFFPLESQLGQEFAEVNNLIRRKDESGKPCGGMFDKNRRVRAQTLRGEKSMGFFCPLSYLEKLIQDVKVEVNQEIEDLQGFSISKKYLVSTKQGQGKQGSKTKQGSRIISNQFHFHFNTTQLGKNTHRLQSEDLISITWKTHGTSGICGNVLTKRKLSWFDKALRSVGISIPHLEYDYVFSSRRVVKNDTKKYNHYYDVDIWSLVGEDLRGKLHKGETLYYEILGYLPGGGYIQKGYDYGCAQGARTVQVYRVTQTNVDGVVTELPWHQVVHRCKEIGVDTVPEIFYGKAGEYFSGVVNESNTLEQNQRMWQEGFLNKIQQEFVYDQDCQFCKNVVPAEGVVVRVERGDGIENYKCKSFRFYGHETKMLDAGESDTESEES